MQWIDWMYVAVVSCAAIGRSIGIFVAKLRQLAYRRRATAYPSSWRDRCAQPEPFLLFAMTLGLLASREVPVDLSIPWVLGSAAGGLTALSGISLMLWAFLSFPSVSPGHYILPDHRIVTKGPYGWVRHPLYLAALLIWFGLTITFRSFAALLLTLVYVVPAYAIYMRSEEQMMIGHFGDAYRDYSGRVGMLFPRRRPASSEGRAQARRS